MGTVRQGERASGNITNRTIYVLVWYTLYDHFNTSSTINTNLTIDQT